MRFINYLMKYTILNTPPPACILLTGMAQWWETKVSCINLEWHLYKVYIWMWLHLLIVRMTFLWASHLVTIVKSFLSKDPTHDTHDNNGAFFSSHCSMQSTCIYTCRITAGYVSWSHMHVAVKNWNHIYLNFRMNREFQVHNVTIHG